MIINPARYKKCKTCGKSGDLISEETVCCDLCRKSTVEDLHTQIFFSDNRKTETRVYCSWPCLRRDLQTIKTDYFVSLPYLLFDERKDSPTGATAFFKTFGIKRKKGA